MKDAKLTLLGAILVTSAPLARAYPIVGDYSFADHWDDYVYRFTPGHGWSSEMVGGNNEESYESFYVESDPARYGRPSRLALTFSYRITASVGGDDYLDPELDGTENFAGVNPFGATATFSSDVFPEFSDTITITDGVGTGGQGTFTVPFVVRLGKTYTVTIGMGHVDFVAGTFNVFDPNSIAAVEVQTYAEMSLDDIRIVPDGGSTAALLVIGVAGLMFATGWYPSARTIAAVTPESAESSSTIRTPFAPRP